MERMTQSQGPGREADEARLAAAVEDAICPAARAEWERHLVHEQVLIGRQAIFTHQLRTFGYQLSFRAASRPEPAALAPIGPSCWSDLQHEHATSHVLRATFGRRDLEQVARGRCVFVRFPRAHLVGDLPVPPHPDRLVIEVSDQVTIDPAVIAGIRRLRQQGFRLAMPGFVSRPDQRRLLPHVDFVKIDVRDLDVEGRPVVELARAHGALLIAEFVEERRHLEHAAELGFHLVQGNLLEPTAVLDRSAAPITRAAL